MSATDISEQQKMVSLLKHSFPQAFLPPKPDEKVWVNLPADAIVLDDDEEFRSSLMLFSAEDLLKILPMVLADLLVAEDRSGVESVVNMLNVSLETAEAFQETKNYFGLEIAEKLHKDDEELYFSKLESFSRFNQEQAFAVYEWLNLVRGWPEFEDSSADVKSAIQYWKARAEGADF